MFPTERLCTCREGSGGGEEAKHLLCSQCEGPNTARNHYFSLKLNQVFGGLIMLESAWNLHTCHRLWRFTRAVGFVHGGWKNGPKELRQLSVWNFVHMCIMCKKTSWCHDLNPTESRPFSIWCSYLRLTYAAALHFISSASNFDNDRDVVPIQLSGGLIDQSRCLRALLWLINQSKTLSCRGRKNMTVVDITAWTRFHRAESMLGTSAVENIFDPPTPCWHLRRWFAAKPTNQIIRPAMR